MTKAKTTAAEAETPPVDTTTEGQDAGQAAEASGEDPALFQASEAPEQTPPLPTEEQEAARLEAEAMLAAQAEAEAAAAAAEAPALDLNALTFLATQIDMLNGTGHRLGLVDELIGLYRAEITEREDEGIRVTMQGISIEPADSMETALTNWANAARRAVLGVTA